GNHAAHQSYGQAKGGIGNDATDIINQPRENKIRRTTVRARQRQCQRPAHAHTVETTQETKDQARCYPLHNFSLRQLNYDNFILRDELATTSMLLLAIASAANSGLINPATASGMAMILYKKAQPRFWRILFFVRSMAVKAAVTLCSLSWGMTICADSAAMAVRSPKAMPRSASASASASLLPSPTIATFPDFFSSRIISVLDSGRAPAKR